MTLKSDSRTTACRTGEPIASVLGSAWVLWGILAVAFCIGLPATSFGQVTLKGLKDELQGTRFTADQLISVLASDAGRDFILTPAIVQELRDIGATEPLIDTLISNRPCQEETGPVSLDELVCRVQYTTISEDEIVGLIRTRGPGFDLTPDSLRYLDEVARVTLSLGRRIVPLLFVRGDGPTPTILREVLERNYTSDELLTVVNAWLDEHPLPAETVDEFALLLEIGVDPATLTGVVRTGGVRFDWAGSDETALREAGTDDALVQEVAFQSFLRNGSPVLPWQVLLLGETGLSVTRMIDLMFGNGAAFPGFVPGFDPMKPEPEERDIHADTSLSASLAEATFSDEMWEAIVAEILGQAGWTPLNVSISDNYDGPTSEGTIEVRLSVDDVDDVYVFGSKVFRKTQSGEASAAGTAELTGPLPRHGVIRLDSPSDAKRDGRGDWDYLELPEDNGNRILFTVYDRRGGDDRYEFRFRWKIEE